jgi:NADPH:quinone reductase-like Zn-dependent oxidoreductase
MRAAVVTRYGGPDVLEIREVPVPTPKPDQILVRVRAIGLNFADIFGRLGVYPGTPKPPFIPGLEFSGDVEVVGSEVKHLKKGQPVMGYSRHGSHAEYVVVSGEAAVRMPRSMGYEEGASFITTSMTAYHGLVRLANLRKGERLLVHAAAGGVGLATIQLARHLGAEIFATAGRDDKVALARAQGAHHGFNYTTTDFATEIRRLTGGAGVDVVMDSVGGTVYARSWKLLAPMGRYIILGVSAVSGKRGLNYLRAARVLSAMLPIFPSTLISRNKAIMGFNLGTLTGKEPYLREAALDIRRLQRAGVFQPLIGKVFPFEQIAEAHRYLQSRESMGKVVVRIDVAERR